MLENNLVYQNMECFLTKKWEVWRLETWKVCVCFPPPISLYSIALDTDYVAIIQKIWLLFQAMLFSPYRTASQDSVYFLASMSSLHKWWQGNDLLLNHEGVKKWQDIVIYYHY